MSCVADATNAPILEAYGPGEEGVGARVGYGGVTRIEAYNECGQMACVPWLRVWRGDVLYMRLNAAQMEFIRYGKTWPHGVEPTEG